MDTKQIGNITELEVLTYLTKLGYQISIPFGDRARYDQVIDVNGVLYRIQIKSSKLVNGSLEIPCKSSVRINGRTVNKRYTADEIDFLATYYNNKCYMIPVEHLPGRIKKLRVEKSKNNQESGISFIEDYEAEKILERVKTK